MGYSVQRFVDQVDPNLLCPVCQNVCEMAVLTWCGHTFCQSCLTDWLSGPSQTCPQCRQTVSLSDTRPIWSVRNLIASLTVTCSEEPCTEVLRLEHMEKHREYCIYVEESCQTCDLKMARHAMIEHQAKCRPIRLEVDLEIRVSSLERQVKRVSEDLKAAQFRNDFLERELIRTRASLEDRRHSLGQPNVTPQHNRDVINDVTQQCPLAKLRHFIAKYLLRKPDYVETGRVFGDIQRLYLENSDNEVEVTRNNLHMLLVTASASDWFTENQKRHFDMWMMDMARYQARVTS